MQRNAHDIITAVPLSFLEDDSLDMAGSKEILEYVARSGVQGALILGTTGEFPSLSIAERNAVAALAVDVLGDMRVIVHVGAASRFEVSQLMAGARAAGAREIAVLTPFYLPTPPEQVHEFFQAVAEEAAGLDVFLYLFEARTGVAVDDELLVRVAALPGVVGVKVSGEELGRIGTFRAQLPEGFTIYTGSDADFATAHTVGADGVISGVASAFAKPFVAMREALLRGDDAAVDALRADLAEVVDAIRGEPSRMRAVHRLAGRAVGGSRMPIPEPDDASIARLKRNLPRFH